MARFGAVVCLVALLVLGAGVVLVAAPASAGATRGGDLPVVAGFGWWGRTEYLGETWVWDPHDAPFGTLEEVEVWIYELDFADEDVVECYAQEWGDPQPYLVIDGEAEMSVREGVFGPVYIMGFDHAGLWDVVCREYGEPNGWFVADRVEVVEGQTPTTTTTTSSTTTTTAPATTTTTSTTTTTAPATTTTTTAGTTTTTEAVVCMEIVEAVESLTGWVQIVNGALVVGMAFLVFLMSVQVVGSWRK